MKRDWALVDWLLLSIRSRDAGERGRDVHSMFERMNIQEHLQLSYEHGLVTLSLHSPLSWEDAIDWQWNVNNVNDYLGHFRLTAAGQDRCDELDSATASRSV